MAPYATTLKALRDACACKPSYDLLANRVGVDFEGEISLETILDNNGLEDCIWALRATDGGKDLASTFAILCSLRHYTEPAYVSWAKKWMSGEDRSYAATRAAYVATRAARTAAVAAVAFVAADAAYVAADAAYAAYAATRAARTAARAAYVAADAARTAADAAVEWEWQKETLRKLIRNEYKG